MTKTELIFIPQRIYWRSLLLAGTTSVTCITGMITGSMRRQTALPVAIVRCRVLQNHGPLWSWGPSSLCFPWFYKIAAPKEFKFWSFELCPSSGTWLLAILSSSPAPLHDGTCHQLPCIHDTGNTANMTAAAHCISCFVHLLGLSEWQDTKALFCRAHECADMFPALILKS